MSLFGQDDPDPDPCDAALHELLGSPPDGPDPPPDIRAVARNLSHDQRVPRDRAVTFRDSLPQPVTAAGLASGLKRYHEDRVLYQVRPEFVDEGLNGPNILSGTGSGAHRIHKDRPLARILDLNGLVQLYDWAKPRLPDFPLAPLRNPDDPRFKSWLKGQLKDASPPRLRRFIESTLEVLNAYRAEVGPYQPSWATSWERFAEHLTSPVERWLALLGIYKPVVGHWFIVLKYAVREAGTLARPTVLDAGWAAHHFPSPPAASLDNGGHPMDLDLDREDDLLPEYIHDQMEKYELRHWQAAGALCRETIAATPPDLESQRRKHHLLLQRHYGEDRVLSWMPEPC